jgi:GT2 family glycosyltransferase
MSDAACDVSVSVVTYDSARCLPGLLAGLRAQTGVTFETLVVDNGSRDDTRALLARADGIDVTLNEDNVGFGRAHNQTLARCRGRYVLLLNPDVRFASDLLARLVAWLDAHPECALAGPRVLEGDVRREFPPRRSYPGEAMVPLDRDDARGAIAWLNGCCLIARREVLDALRGFDPDFFLYGEEVDLCLRARRAGHVLGFCPDAVVHHLQQQSQTAIGAEERSRRLFEGIATFWEKHHQPADVRRMLRFQSWACRFVLLAAPILPLVARRWPSFDVARIRARGAVCRQRLGVARGARATLRELPYAIALRHVTLLQRWIRDRALPLDDY